LSKLILQPNDIAHNLRTDWYWISN